MRRRHRLSRSRDFEAVFRHGRSVSSRYLVLHSFPRPQGADAPARLGLAVPKAIGTAVVRNRVKRLLREAWRGLAEEIPPGYDFVLTARPGLAEVVEARGHGWLERELRAILARGRP